MKFLDGWKTVIGAGGLLIGTFVPKLAPTIGQLMEPALTLGTNVAGVVATIGIIHKIIKSRGSSA